MLPAALFVAVNCYGSFVFFRMNNYKTAAALAAVSTLFLFIEFFQRSHEQWVWKAVTLPLLIPIIGLAPGWLVNGGTVNYLLPLTLGSQLLLIAWAGLLISRVRLIRELQPFVIAVALVTAGRSLAPVKPWYGTAPILRCSILPRLTG